MYRVLLVDDEVFARQGLRNLIDWASCGFEVIKEAGNGEDALSIIHTCKPNLVITDIRMPVLDGMELIRLTLQEQSNHTSFIIISGFDDFKYAQQAVRYGVHDFILKPIDKELLEAALIQLHRRLIIEKSANYDRELLLHNKIITSLIKGELNTDTLTDHANLLGISPNSKLIYTFVEVNATIAMASLASSGPYTKSNVELFWQTPIRTGDRRYYDNCLYLFTLLALSGNYRIYLP